jgi:hypothetical protein
MSASEMSPDPERASLEAALFALRPARSRLDHGRVMYLAGRASVPQPGGRLWTIACAAVTASSLAFGVGCLVLLEVRTRVHSDRLQPVAAAGVRSDRLQPGDAGERREDRLKPVTTNEPVAPRSASAFDEPLARWDAWDDEPLAAFGPLDRRALMLRHGIDPLDPPRRPARVEPSRSIRRSPTYGEWLRACQADPELLDAPQRLFDSPAAVIPGENT